MGYPIIPDKIDLLEINGVLKRIHVFILKMMEYGSFVDWLKIMFNVQMMSPERAEWVRKITS
jgi:hypothetical protein